MNTYPSNSEIQEAELSMFDSRMPSDAPPVKESNARHALNAVQTDQDFSRTDLEAIKKDLVPHFGEDEANKIIRDYTGVDMAQAQPATPPVAPPAKTKPEWIQQSVDKLEALEAKVEAIPALTDMAQNDTAQTAQNDTSGTTAEYNKNIVDIQKKLNKIKKAMEDKVKVLKGLNLQTTITVQSKSQTPQTTST